jgi:hypothetical protein
MNFIGIIFFVFSLLMSTILWAQTSYVAPTDTLAKDGTEVVLYSQYFPSLTSWDYNGKEVPRADNESYMSLDNGIEFSYGFSDRFQMSLLFNTRYNRSEQMMDDKLETFTALGAQRVGGSFRYHWPFEKQWQYSVDVFYYTALNTYDHLKEDETYKEIVLGDSGNDLGFKLATTYLTNSNNLVSARVTYRSPGLDLSNEILSELEMAFVWRKVALYAGVENNYSLSQDMYTDVPEDKPQIPSGMTQNWNSINRSWFAPYAGLNLAFNNEWRLESRFTNVMMGNSTDGGLKYFFAFVRRTGDKSSYRKENKKFKSYKVEAQVTKLSPKGKYFVIDKGLASDVTQGMRFDFYEFDYLGGNKLIATGYAVKVSADSSIIQISSRFSKRRIKEGTLARGGIIND